MKFVFVATALVGVSWTPSRAISSNADSMEAWKHIALLLADLECDGDLHTAICRALGELVVQLRDYVTPETVQSIIERTVEAFVQGSDKQQETFIDLRAKFALDEAEHERETVFVATVVPTLAPYLIAVLGSDATSLDDSTWNLTRTCRNCLSLFARCAPDLILRDCLAQIDERSDEQCLMKSFLILQVTASIDLPQAAHCYMQAFRQ
jgi:hypothetical protein